MTDERAFLEAAYRLAARSLVVFLHEHARPAPGEERFAAALARQAELERDHALEIAEILEERGVALEPGDFPESFAGLRAVALASAVEHVVRDLRSQRDELERIFALFRGDVTAETLNAIVSLRDERIRHLVFWESVER